MERKISVSFTRGLVRASIGSVESAAALIAQEASGRANGSATVRHEDTRCRRGSLHRLPFHIPSPQARGRRAGAFALSAPFVVHLGEPLARQPRRRSVAETLHDLAQRRARLGPVLQLIVAISNLEQRIRRLARIGVLLQYGAEVAQGFRVLAGDVM